jgi:hypothetical protein
MVWTEFNCFRAGSTGIKYGVFFDQLNNHQLLKYGPVPGSQLLITYIIPVAFVMFVSAAET